MAVQTSPHDAQDADDEQDGEGHIGADEGGGEDRSPRRAYVYSRVSTKGAYVFSGRRTVSLVRRDGAALDGREDGLDARRHVELDHSIADIRLDRRGLDP